ncbi:hypothetical protein OC835_007922, partial [Tilletia horrida]
KLKADQEAFEKIVHIGQQRLPTSRHGRGHGVRLGLAHWDVRREGMASNLRGPGSHRLLFFLAGRDRLLRGCDLLKQHGIFDDLGLLPDHRRDFKHAKAKKQRCLAEAALADSNDAKVRICLLKARLAQGGEGTRS